MLLSIITINYNNLLGLIKTFNSVTCQTSNKYEWIVIDGGSTDGSKSFLDANCEKFDYYVSEPDKGIYNAMNKAIDVVTGDYCLFLNSGDYLISDKVIETILPELHSATYIFTDIVKVDNRGTKLGVSNYKKQLNVGVCFWYNFTACHQGMYIKSLSLKQRPYNENLKIVSDWEHAFYEIVIQNCQYKIVDTISTCVTIGGYSSKNKALMDYERRHVALSYFNSRVLDEKYIEYCFKYQHSSYREDISSLACTSIINCRYDKATFYSIFSEYRNILLKYGTIKTKTINWLAFHGFYCIIKLVCFFLNKRKL